MSALVQAVQNKLHYTHGYLHGSWSAAPRSWTDLYAIAMSRLASLLTLPLPLLSLVALPLYGGSSTTINLLFFHLTWSSLVLAHSPLTIELYGSLAVRLLCFVIPACVSLVFDCALPKISRGAKAHGSRHLPHRYGRHKILQIVAVAVFNTVLSVLVQAVLEQAATRVFRLRSFLKVTTTAPLPWTVAADLFRGLVVRSLVHYFVHRFMLHRPRSTLEKWHRQWQHSIDLPFSLVAAYDHPVNFMLNSWLPAFLPAYLFRWHVLTWHLFLAIISLEDLLVFSGYGVLPLPIVLAGMARRTDAHFNSVTKRQSVGNFGYLGLVDLLVGSTCKDEVDLLDDAFSEANKHRLQQRIDAAVDAAVNGAEPKGRGSSKKTLSKASSYDGTSGPDNPEETETRADKSLLTRRKAPQRKARTG